ncbi:MAG: glycosyltransferase family 4 protein [Chloroflexota bacterium]
MRISFYHGYELTGSGSNEYTRYLTTAYLAAGHEVHVICREHAPEKLPFVSQAFAWSLDGNATQLFSRETETAPCVLHQLPHGPVRPVYLTDKQREGNVKSFVQLSDAELAQYHDENEQLLQMILERHNLDVLHANHVVYQPVAAQRPCLNTDTPLVIYPHGSSIEYTVKPDARYQSRAIEAMLAARHLIIGNHEVRDRILKLYPEERDALLAKTSIVGVGVDTSLFQPVARSKRQEAIAKLQATMGGGGKKPAQVTELHQRLDSEGVAATRAYWNAYNHKLPDDDLNEHLQRIPWQDNILLFVGALTAGKGLQSVLVALPEVLQSHPNTHLVIVGAGAYREVLEALVYAISEGKTELLLELCEKGITLDRNDLSGPWEDVQQVLQDPNRLAALLEHGRELLQHVHFVGRLDHSRLCHLFPCADLAVFPSVVPEAYPLVLMESLSNGVLPAVSYFSGFRDGVDELKAYLEASLLENMRLPVDPTVRIPRIAAQLTALLNAPLEDIKPQLRQIAEEHYDWTLKAAQMVEAYQVAIDAGN